MPKNNNNAQTSTSPAAVAARKEEAAALDARYQELAKSGFPFASPGVLDRTTADIVAGKRSAPTSQLNPEQQRMIKVHYLNQEAVRGGLSPDQYRQKLAEIEGTTAQLQDERTMRFANIAATKAKSETAKQDEARTIAGMQGVAVGTISKQGQANTSMNSILSQNQASSFAEGQKNLNKMQADILKENGVKEKQNYNYNVSLGETLSLEDSIQQPSYYLIAGKKFESTPEIDTIVKLSGRTTTKLGEQIYLGSLEDKGIKVTDKGKELINLFKFENIGWSELERKSTYTDTKTGQKFDAKKMEGSSIIANALGFKSEEINQNKKSFSILEELRTGNAVKKGLASVFTGGDILLTELQKRKKDDRWYSVSVEQLLTSGFAANQVIYKGVGDLSNILDSFAPVIRSGASSLVKQYKENTAKQFGTSAPVSLALEKILIPPNAKTSRFEVKGTTADTEIIPITESLGWMGKEEWSSKQKDFIKKYGIVSYSSQIGAGWGLGVEAAPSIARGTAAGIVKYSPIKVLAPSVGDTTVYKGLGLALGKKPPISIIGSMEGKIVIGNKSLASQIIKTAQTTGRYGGEIVLQSNPSGSLLVSQKTIDDLVSSGYLNKLSGIRADVRQQATYQVQKGGKEYSGTAGPLEFKGSPEESKYILERTKSLQEGGHIEVLGGSPVIVSSLAPEIKKQFPYFVKIGDFDIHPLLKKAEIKAGITLEQKADSLIKYYAMDYPTPKGSRLETTHKLGTNRALNIVDSITGKKRKPVEIVMINAKQQPLESLSGITEKADRTFILQYELKKDKTKFTADYNIETYTMKDQELTNVKTGLNLRDWELTAGRSSWISGLANSDIQFHHLIKKGPGEVGILLTRREHLGITALQGQLGKIRQPKGSDVVLDLIGERKGKSLPPQHSKKLSEYLSVPENRAFVQNVLEEAASQVKDPKKFRGMPLSKDSARLSQKILRRERIFGEPIEYKPLKTKESFFDRGIPAAIKNKLLRKKTVGADIKFRDIWDQSYAMTFEGNTSDIFIQTGLRGGYKKTQEEKLADIISHETTHNVLEKEISKEASINFDNLVYSDADMVEKVKGLTRDKIVELSVPQIKRNDFDIAQMIPKEKIKFEETVFRWQELDQPAKKMLYPQPGREAKDTARDLISTYQTAYNQKQRFNILGAKKTQKIAEKFESIYPEINFRGFKDTPRNIRLITNDTPHGMDKLNTNQKLITPLLTASRPKERKPDQIKTRSDNLSYSTQRPSSSIISSKNIRNKPTSISSSIISSKNIRNKPTSISSSIISSKNIRNKPTSLISSIRGSDSQTYNFPKNKTRLPKGDIPTFSSITYPKTPTTTKITPPPIINPPSKNPPSRPPPSITGSERTTKGSLSLSRREKSKPVIIIPNILNTTKKAPGKSGDTHNFLGSSRVADLVGFRTKTSDITVGDKKTRKLYYEDIEKSRKKFYGITGTKTKKASKGNSII